MFLFIFVHVCTCTCTRSCVHICVCVCVHSVICQDLKDGERNVRMAQEKTLAKARSILTGKSFFVLGEG